MKNLTRKEKLELEILKQDNNIPNENIPIFIYEDLKNYLAQIKIENEKLHYVVEQCSGLLLERKSLEEIAVEFSVTRESIRQLYNKFFKKFYPFSRVNPNILQMFIKDILMNIEDPEIVFPQLRAMFAEVGNFYSFLERLANIDKAFYPYLPKSDSPIGYYSNRIFDDYCISNKLPISLSETISLISKSYNCLEITSYFICFNLIRKNMVKFDENGIIPLSPSIPTMIAQACLYLEHGASYEDIRAKATEIFNYKFLEQERLNSAILQAASLDYVYLYGDGGARHVMFFKKYYSEEKINKILEQSYNFINHILEKNCKISDLFKNCFNETIHYHDLRYIIKKYGSNYSKSIYFNGKSNQDIAYIKNI